MGEKELREEFERQHAGRRLDRHRLRGTYLSPNIAALWNQHVWTAKWIEQSRESGADGIETERV